MISGCIPRPERHYRCCWSAGVWRPQQLPHILGGSHPEKEGAPSAHGMGCSSPAHPGEVYVNDRCCHPSSQIIPARFPQTDLMIAFLVALAPAENVMCLEFALAVSQSWSRRTLQARHWGKILQLPNMAWNRAITMRRVLVTPHLTRLVCRRSSSPQGLSSCMGALRRHAGATS